MSPRRHIVPNHIADKVRSRNSLTRLGSGGNNLTHEQRCAGILEMLLLRTFEFRESRDWKYYARDEEYLNALLDPIVSELTMEAPDGSLRLINSHETHEKAMDRSEVWYVGQGFMPPVGIPCVRVNNLGGSVTYEDVTE